MLKYNLYLNDILRDDITYKGSFVGDGFLSKLSKHFWEGEYLKFHRKEFAEKEG